MFEHITVLLSFVFALAASQLLTSATELVWARKRVRVSWIQLLWMFILFLELFVNWIGMFYLNARPRWDIFDISLSFVMAVLEYFCCSLISIRVRDHGAVDMPAFYEGQRRILFSVYLTLTVIGMFVNWWNGSTPGLDPDVWIWADLTIAPTLLLGGLAGWARPMWLQRLAGLGMLALDIYFLITYTL